MLRIACTINRLFTSTTMVTILFQRKVYSYLKRATKYGAGSGSMITQIGSILTRIVVSFSMFRPLIDYECFQHLN